MARGDRRFDITDEQTVFYTRMLFNDDVAAVKKLTPEARKACQFIGLSPASLVQKDFDDVKS